MVFKIPRDLSWINFTRSAADGYLTAEAIPFLGHTNQLITFKKVRWALRFPLPPPFTDASSRRSAFRQGPRRGEAFEGAIRAAASLSYANESSICLPDSHLLRLPNFVARFGLPRRNVNPAPPDQPTCQWLRSGAIRLSQRDEGDKDSMPLGIFAYFNGDISIDQVIELIQTHKTTDREELRRMRGLFRGNSSVRLIPRLAHPKQALLEQAAAARGAKAPPAPPTPRITPIPEVFSPDVPTVPTCTSPKDKRKVKPRAKTRTGAKAKAPSANPLCSTSSFGHLPFCLQRGRSPFPYPLTLVPYKELCPAIKAGHCSLSYIPLSMPTPPHLPTCFAAPALHLLMSAGHSSPTTST